MTGPLAASTTPVDGWRLGGVGGKQRLIPDPTTGKLIAYQRTSTFAGTLDDKSGLGDWKAWMALKGAVENRALREAALHATRTPKGVIKSLIEAGGGGVKRDRGSNRHQLVKMALSGASLPPMPPQARAELDAVLALISSLGDVVAAEAPNVCDEWQVAGSCDLVLTAPDGATVVADLKTGDHINLVSWSVQLIAYARARYWDGDSETRGGLVAPTRPRLIVIHAPQSGAQPRPIELDVDRARRWADLSHEVREARRQAGKEARALTREGT